MSPAQEVLFSGRQVTGARRDKKAWSRRALVLAVSIQAIGWHPCDLRVFNCCGYLNHIVSVDFHKALGAAKKQYTYTYTCISKSIYPRVFHLSIDRHGNKLTYRFCNGT